MAYPLAVSLSIQEQVNLGVMQFEHVLKIIDLQVERFVVNRGLKAQIVKSS